MRLRYEEGTMSHTPGPWAWTSPDILMAPSDRVLLVDGKPTKADARLIAAAPDLLAALEYVVMTADVPHVLSGRSPTVAYESLVDARDAIAKAKGES